jgi:hypothetical protein
MASVFGSISKGFVYQPATDPGKANPSAHYASNPETEPNRADAQAPGGWQPLDWDLVPVTKDRGGPRPAGGHVSDGTHLGEDPSGTKWTPDSPLSAPLDEFASVDGVPESLARMGAAGAAHGGVRASGSSEPWANPGGIRLGRRRTPLAWLHAADTGSLHFNTPKVRPILIVPLINGRSNSPFPGAIPGGTPATSPYNPLRPAVGFGVAQPYLRRIIKPYGQGDYPRIETNPQAVLQDPGPVGGEWAL